MIKTVWLDNPPVNAISPGVIAHLYDELGDLGDARVVVLRGRGMPVLHGLGRGDQRVLVNVVVPRHLSDEQRRLLHEFEEHVDERTYEKDEGGLFDKLKNAFR